MGTTIRPEVSGKNGYWISKHRYYELKHFCLQYPDWKKAYISLDGYFSHSGSVLERVKGGETPDITAEHALQRLWLRERMDMVEAAAGEAAGDLAGMMLKAVTEGLSYEALTPPCCREVWYTAYRRFFWTLDQIRR